ncbi:MAG: hypothetical protein ACI9VR_002879 [Cognaticolwellia sp.]|jgi:hypothetical protein
MVSIGIAVFGLFLFVEPAAAEGLGEGGSGHQSVSSSEGKGISFGSGGYSDGVVIDVPAGVAGHTPKLSLNIAPGTSDGPVGQNWTIGGLS